MDCVIQPNKRLKLNPEPCTKEDWTRHRSSLVEEDMLDIGVSHLHKDLKDQSWDENHPDFINFHTMSKHLTPEKREKHIALLQSTLTKDTLHKITMGEWDELLLPNYSKFTTDKINHFERLSEEVMLSIFHWLPRHNLKNVAMVCRRWNRLVMDESLWTRMDISSRYLPPGAIGQLMSRQVILLRLSQSEVAHPPILPGVKADMPEFKSRLMYLDLSMALISPNSLAVIFNKCYRLKKLSLENVTVDASVFSALAQNVDLEVLNLAMTVGINKEGLQYLLKGCKKLREVNLSWTHLSTPCIEYLCRHLPATMDRLNLSGCKKMIIDDNIADLIQTCQNLRELDLSDCTGLTGNSIEHISTLKDINFLVLSRCYFIPCHSLTYLKRLKSLTNLDIHGGHVSTHEQKVLQEALGQGVQIDKFKFSSIARPAVGQRKSTIWGLKIRY